MRLDLDKAERLIVRIRSLEAELDGLYAEWEQTFGSARKVPENHTETVKKGGRKPQPDSLQGRLIALFEGFPGLPFSVEDAAQAQGVNEPDLARVRRALDKLVSVGKISRKGRGMFGANDKDAAA